MRQPALVRTVQHYRGRVAPQRVEETVPKFEHPDERRFAIPQRRIKSGGKPDGEGDRLGTRPAAALLVAAVEHGAKRCAAVQQKHANPWRAAKLVSAGAERRGA